MKTIFYKFAKLSIIGLTLVFAVGQDVPESKATDMNAINKQADALEKNKWMILSITRSINNAIQSGAIKKHWKIQKIMKIR